MGDWEFFEAARCLRCQLRRLFFVLASACWGVYPVLPPATTGAANGITLGRALSGQHMPAVGLARWLFGMALALTYEVFNYSRFKGKVRPTTAGH
jgi:cytochrome bd-type quinol oxidase subunit 2